MNPAQKKLAIRLLLLAAAVGGLALFGKRSTHVTQVPLGVTLPASPVARTLDVTITRGGEPVRALELPVAPAATWVGQEVALPPGEYDALAMTGQGTSVLQARKHFLVPGGSLELSLGGSQ